MAELDWRAHKGNRRPVPKGTWVKTRLRADTREIAGKLEAERAETVVWLRDGSACQVEEYAVVPEPAWVSEPAKGSTRRGTMGYTHYWRSSRAATAEEWATLCDAARKIIAAGESQGIHVAYEDDQPGKPPEIDSSNIRFNGIGEEGHETFLLKRDSSSFEFCKTAHKPYDTIVTAILHYAVTAMPGVWRVSSDGDIDSEDWAPGRQLAAQATGCSAEPFAEDHEDDED